MSNKFWIGCDISKSTFWIAVAEVGHPGMDWPKLRHHEFGHTEDGVAAFVAWLEGLGIGRQEVAGICLESTGRLSRQWPCCLKSVWVLCPSSIRPPQRPSAQAWGYAISRTVWMPACAPCLAG